MRKGGRKGGRGLAGLLPIVLAASGASCSDFDATRTPPPQASLGEEIYGVVCDRVGAQSLHEDLTGASYAGICHRLPDGTFASQVDTSQLPALVDGATDASGKPVPLARQQQDRAYGIARVETMGKHRTDLIEALDATFPDKTIPIKDITNPDPTQSCTAAAAPGSLHTELANLLGRFDPLYDDGTIPQATEALADVANAFHADADAQTAWAIDDARAGYRPIDMALGVARSVTSYPGLRDFADSALSLLSADSDPYASSPTPGAAHTQLESLLAAGRAELANATVSPALPLLTVTVDPQTNRTLLSRPRNDLEFLQSIFYAQDASFGAGQAHYIAARDPRGYAVVSPIGGKIPAPFVDADGDGLADVDGFGQFVTTGTTPAPSPFLAVGAPNAVARDTFGRALPSSGGAPIYGSLDTSHTYTASLAHTLQPLVDPNPADSRETLMNLLAGAYVIAGARTPGTTKSYADGQKVTYSAFGAASSPLLDLIYAFGSILADPTADDTLSFAEALVKGNPNDVARVTGDILYSKDIANADSTAHLPATSTLWDELIDVAIEIEQEPGLLEDVLRAFGNPATVSLGSVFGGYAQYDDRISYDRNNLNGPAFNFTTNSTSPPSTAPDRSMPDANANRTEMQRFVQVVHDANGVAACNKQGAVVHAQGLPVVGSLDVCDGGPCSLGGTPFDECKVYKIDNLAAFFLDSIVGQATFYFRGQILREGLCAFGLCVGAATVGVVEQSSGIGYDSSDADAYNGPDPSQDGFWDLATSTTLRPKTAWLNRHVFFDLANDSPTRSGPNYRTNHFFSDLNEEFGSAACPERVIPDPCKGDSSCGSGADVAPDGMVHGLRSCPSGEGLFARDQDATFVSEEFGFLNAIAPIVGAFANHKREDLFIALMEVLHKHWQSPQGVAANEDECLLGLDPQTSAPVYCTKDGADSYEPLLGKILPSDLLPALNNLVSVASSINLPTCQAADPAGACATPGPTLDGVSILANAAQALIDPTRAQTFGLVDRQGRKTSSRNDGTSNPQVTPVYLVLEALDEVDQAFATYATAHPQDAGRQAAWRQARSQLVDQLLGTTGENTATQSFVDPSVPAILPVVLDAVRSQLHAHCPSPSGPCAWAQKTFPGDATTSVTGPIFATVLDLADAVRQNGTARMETEKLLTYLLDPTSGSAALPELLASVDDLLQLLNDDKDMVPLYHVLATAAEPGQTDAQGNVHPGVVDATTTLLGRLAGRAYDTSHTEICADELDPNGVLDLALANLVTPMTTKSGAATETPLETILDAISDVNRLSPGSPSALRAGDFGNMASELSQFLLDPDRGLEQFYAIVRAGTKD